MKKIIITVKKGSSRQELEKEIWEQITEVLGLDAEGYPLMRVGYEEDRRKRIAIDMIEEMQKRGQDAYKGGGLKKSHEISHVEETEEGDSILVDRVRKTRFLETFLPELQKFLDNYNLTSYFESMRNNFEADIFNEGVSLADGFLKAAISPTFVFYFEEIMGLESVGWKNEVLTKYKEFINLVLDKWLDSPFMVDRQFINQFPDLDRVDIDGEIFVNGYDLGKVVQVFRLTVLKKRTGDVEFKGKVVIAAKEPEPNRSEEPEREVEVEPSAFEAIGEYQERKQRGKPIVRSHEIPKLEKERQGLFGRKKKAPPGGKSKT